MKKIVNISILLCICIAGVYSCRPDNDFSLTKPQNRVAQLAGTWKLQSVLQIDLLAKSNNFVDPARPDINLLQQDITNIAPFTDLAVTFVNDGSNVPSTFSINYGAAPKIFKLNGGTWKVDDLNAPGNIKFINGPDTVKTILGNVNNLSAGMLTLQLTKFQGIKPVIQYNYNFIKN